MTNTHTQYIHIYICQHRYIRHTGTGVCAAFDTAVLIEVTGDPIPKPKLRKDGRLALQVKRPDAATPQAHA